MSDKDILELLKQMQQNSENNAKLIELLGKRIDQIWTFLEVAGIAHPTTQPRKDK